MSVTNVFGIYAVNLGGTTVPVQSCSLGQGISEIVLGSSGDVEAGFAAIMAQSPVISCATSAIKILLDAIGTPWQAKSMTATFYFRKHLASGARSAAGDFISITCATGMLVPKPLAFNHGGIAAMGFDYIPVSTTGVAPHVVATGVANPGLTTLLAAQWTAGPVKINAATPLASKYTGVLGGSIDPGITVTSMGGDGEVFPSFVGVSTARPTISLSLSDANALKDIGVEGVAGSAGASASTVYLWKLSANGSRIVKTSTVHIAFTVNAGIITVPGMGGSHPSAIGSQIKITPVYDGTNREIVVSTASAIPATV